MTVLPILRNALTALALAALAFGCGGAEAATYPTQKITVIVAFAPGGVADTLARLIGQGLSERLHQSVVVENRGGAGGNIAAELVARASPDGYTLLATTTALAINETLFVNKQFSASDFKTVAIAASSPEALVTSPNNPANNLKEFIKAMNGRTINLAIPGVGTGSDIEAEYFFKELAKVPVQPIPYQGGAPAINATVGRPGRSDGDHARRRRGGADRGRQAQRPRHRRRQARRGVAEHTDLCRTRLSGVRRRILGRLLRAGQDRSADPADAQRRDQRHRQDPDVEKKLSDMGFDPITGSQPQADSMFAAEVKKWGDMVTALELSIK